MDPACFGVATGNGSGGWCQKTPRPARRNAGGLLGRASTGREFISLPDACQLGRSGGKGHRLARRERGRARQADRAGDRLQMELPISEFEARCLNALVDEMERVLLAVADGAEDLMAAARDRQARLARVGLGEGRVGLGGQPPGPLPGRRVEERARGVHVTHEIRARVLDGLDRKSTRLNSSHLVISYAVFCLKKKKTNDLCRRQSTDKPTSRVREPHR